MSGGIVAAEMGFWISMVPLHFAQRVLTLGRLPSFASSKRYRDWQLVQTMIISSLCLLRSSPGPGADPRTPPSDEERIIRIAVFGHGPEHNEDAGSGSPGRRAPERVSEEAA